MDIYWTTSTIFLFDSWTVQANQPGWFILACSLVVLFTLSVHYLKNYRNKMLDKCLSGKGRFSDLNNWLTSILQGFLYLCDATLMLLMMTYNGWVILVIILSNTVGYIFFNKEYGNKSVLSNKIGCVENHQCCN